MVPCRPVADLLQQRGVDAEARAVADVLKISRYEAVVLGSAIHGGRRLPAARQFADRNAAPLRGTAGLAVQRQHYRRRGEYVPAPGSESVARLAQGDFGGGRDPAAAAPVRAPQLRRCGRAFTLASYRARVLPSHRRPLRRPPELACDRRLGRSHRSAAARHVQRVGSTGPACRHRYVGQERWPGPESDGNIFQI